MGSVSSTASTRRGRGRPAAVPTAPSKDPARIARMFDAISPRYDLLNHLLSANAHT